MYTEEDNTIITELYRGTDVISSPAIEDMIIDWACDRNLLAASTPEAQMLKLVEEVGELARGLCKGDDDLIKDSIGDVFVVLTIIAAQLDVDVMGCAILAYNEIKERKGQMVNGVFIKEVAGA
jgi:NTP pyrophosphatase (non-canonical NTP hydrolase)